METQGHTRLITMKPLIYTVAWAVGHTQRPTCTTYVCKRQSAHAATHSPCSALAWLRARCRAISTAFSRCKSAWPTLERLVGTGVRHISSFRICRRYVCRYIMFAFRTVRSHIRPSQSMRRHGFCVTLHA